MCGIAGVVSLMRAADPYEVDRMSKLVSYRGPDDHGYVACDVSNWRSYFYKDTAELVAKAGNSSFDVVLGHRRLSIIDLSEAGCGPMAYEGGKYWITYNGEVYNYIEIRKELEEKGYRFHTATDTEVMLAAYREWGFECLHKFNGMWAFALVDTERGHVFCARDRLGVKPFYYHFDGATFSFGSEIKQLLELPRVSRRAHAGVLFDFLALGTYGCNSEQTFFQDIKDLRGGNYLVIPLGTQGGGWTPRPVPWWDLDLRSKTEGWTDEQYARRYYELFEDAVRLRLRSDVPVGSCLSGGLDSSGIVCVVDRLLHEAGVTGLQKTFTAVSDHQRFDESEYAQAVVKATRVDPGYVLPTAGRLLEDVEKLVWHQDEPFVSTSIFAGWCVYGLARERGVTVTLDGQGPDEMLGGYVPAMYQALMLENLHRMELIEMFRNVTGVRRHFGLTYGEMGYGMMQELFKGRIPAALMPSIKKAATLLDPDFYAVGVKQSVFLRERRAYPEWCARVGGSPFDRMLYRYTRYDSLPGILRQVDRNSMAFSVEARLPFLDYRLVEYTFSLPSAQKLSCGVAKQVYRRALSGIIPDMIRDRTSKFGFVTAEPEWLRGELRTVVGNRFAGIAPGSPYKRSEALKVFEEITRHGEPGVSSTIIWRIFCVDVWRGLTNQ